MTESNATPDSSPARPRGERPINLILPVVTAVVGFVIGFLISDISRTFSSAPDLPEFKSVPGATSGPSERDERGGRDERPQDMVPEDEQTPEDDAADDAAADPASAPN